MACSALLRRRASSDSAGRANLVWFLDRRQRHHLPSRSGRVSTSATAKVALISVSRPWCLTSALQIRIPSPYHRESLAASWLGASAQGSDTFPWRRAGVLHFDMEQPPPLLQVFASACPALGRRESIQFGLAKQQAFLRFCCEARSSRQSKAQLCTGTCYEMQEQMAGCQH